MPTTLRIAGWALCVGLFATSQFHMTDSFISEAHAKPKKRKVKRVQPKRENVRKCMKFSQVLGADETSIDMTLTSQCKSEVVCKLEWAVICSADPSAKPISQMSRSMTMESGEQWEQSASAGVCESDWQIGSVRWNCITAADNS